MQALDIGIAAPWRRLQWNMAHRTGCPSASP